MTAQRPGRPRNKRKHPTSDDSLINDAVAHLLLRLMHVAEDIWGASPERTLTEQEREWLRRLVDD